MKEVELKLESCTKSYIGDIYKICFTNGWWLYAGKCTKHSSSGVVEEYINPGLITVNGRKRHTTKKRNEYIYKALLNWFEKYTTSRYSNTSPIYMQVSSFYFNEVIESVLEGRLHE